MKRRTAILAAASVSLALIGGSSALAFGTGLFNSGGDRSPGALPPVVNAQTAAGSSGGQASAGSGSTQPHGEDAERGVFGDDHGSGRPADDGTARENHSAPANNPAGHTEDD